ncbi:uncharacterized protein N7482_004631 [Penicillium canariense]|uniref:NmrA-like domain-containing protein n=1 Tax=Penicillium canariense TaxID=189055 RepID=A0A9W9ICS2_9EURO|nr:uncharacterized protein N7482_004631 [Penicillium canariense]KAJ5169037.1 hypothetical protein N7482_004631 [Penicillium canariense]
MTSTKTIIFGPTGHVGSATARTAHQLGAKVVLAMRDVEKPIPGLNSYQENSGGFIRVQADLTKPETVRAAVSATGAKHAFIYIAHGTTDHMRQTIEALKASGIVFVVFLSSFGVQGDARSIPPTDIIAYVHAQVENNLEDVFGTDGYIALRPAFFNTNALWWASMIREGEVRAAYPDGKFDWISPGDIGSVAGSLLVKGIQATEGAEERNVIPLCGPKLVSLRDAMAIFGKALGKDIKVTEVDEDEGVKIMIQNGVPDFVAGPLVKSLGTGDNSEDGSGRFYGDAYKKASANLRKYAGQVTSLEEWAEANKEIFDV